MSQDNRIEVRPNGPLVCSGDIKVLSEDGYVYAKGDDVALCRCGHSKNKPLCDGSHREAEFEDDGMIASLKSEELEDAGAPLKITVRPNAMLVARGPMTIACADESCSTTRNKAGLCRCGHSGNKPFCDGSHKASDFEG